MALNLPKLIITGTDYYTSKKTTEAVSGIDDPETHSWYAEDMEPEEFFTALYSPSLFNSFKLLIVKHAELIKKPDEFINNILRTSNPAAIILVSSDLKKSAALHKAGKAAGFEINTEAKKTGSAKTGEIKALFKEYGLKIDETTANRIGLLTDWNLTKAQGEAEKLALYFAGREDFSSAEITDLIGGQITESNFGFIDAFMERNSRKCLAMYPKLTEISSIFYMLTTYMAGLYFKLTNRALYTSANPFFNGKDYFMRTVVKVSSKWKAQDAAKMISVMAELDVAVKTGRSDIADAVLLMIKEL